MAKIVLQTFSPTGQVVREATFEGPANIYPDEAFSRAEGRWVSFCEAEEVWVDLRVNGKLVSGADL